MQTLAMPMLVAMGLYVCSLIIRWRLRGPVGRTTAVASACLCAWSCRPTPSPPPPPGVTKTETPAPAESEDESPCEAAKLSDDPAARRLQAVVTLLGDPSRDATIAFNRDQATSEMQLRWPLEEQVALLGGWLENATSITLCRVVESTEAQAVGVMGYRRPDGERGFEWLEVDLDPNQESRIVQFQGTRTTSAALGATGPLGVPLVTRSAGGEPRAGDAAARQALVEANLLRSIRPDGRRDPQALVDRMAELQVPGLSIAVIHEGQIDWAQGYGVRQAGEPGRVDTKTMFQAASMSKPVTAIAALRMVEAGTLDLDADINTYLKTWRVPDSEHSEGRPPTIRDIVSHCAGFTVHGFPGYAEGAPVPTVAQILDGQPPSNSAPVRVDKRPGQGFRYSGGGTTVLQQALMDVTKKPFPRILHREVLKTLGMSHSTYAQPLPKRFHANAATGHRGDGQLVEGRWHTYPEMAAAGLWTRPTDLAKLLIDVHRTFVGRGGKLLRATTAQDALRRQCPGMVGQPGSAAGYVGLGFFVAPRTDDFRFGHGGANEGFRGHMVMDARRGSGAVVMTNSDNGSKLVDELLNAVAYVYGWPAHEHREIMLAPLDTAAFDRVAGTYTIAPDPRVDAKTIEFVRDGTALRAVVDGQLVSEMYPAGERTYLLFDPFFVRVEFSAPDDNSVRLELGPLALEAHKRPNTDGAREPPPE